VNTLPAIAFYLNSVLSKKAHHPAQDFLGVKNKKKLWQNECEHNISLCLLVIFTVRSKNILSPLKQK